MLSIERMDVEDVVLDVAGAAKVCNVTVDAMYKRAKNGMAPSHKLGRRVVFLKSELIAYIRSN